MLKKEFLKPKISIDLLGKRQFWTGIIIGIAFSFIISLLLNYSREALRLQTFMGDPFILTEGEFRLYDLFFASFSTSLGLGFTIIYWLTGRNSNIKRGYLKTYVISNAYFITFIALSTVTRFGSILPLTLYHFTGYDNQLDFLSELWLLLLLIPTYIFLNQWNSIRLLLKTKRWVLISFIFYCMITFLLFKTTIVDKNIINQKYYSQNKERFEFINNEFANARQYRVFFSDSINQILQKRQTERVTNLVLDLKSSFNKNETVQLNQLILEKILIHNLNRHGLYFYKKSENRDDNWSYPLPEEVYFQIKKHNVKSIETQVLFEILNEQALLFMASKINWKEREKYSYFEREKWQYKTNLLRSTVTVQSRLIQILDLLRSDNKYENYHHLLPVLKFDSLRGRQKQIKLEITDANNAYIS